MGICQIQKRSHSLQSHNIKQIEGSNNHSRRHQDAKSQIDLSQQVQTAPLDLQTPSTNTQKLIVLSVDKEQIRPIKLSKFNSQGSFQCNFPQFPPLDPYVDNQQDSARSSAAAATPLIRVDLEPFKLQKIPLCRVYSLQEKDEMANLQGSQPQKDLLTVISRFSQERRRVQALSKSDPASIQIINQLQQNKLEHQNLIKIYEIYEDDMWYFVVQDYHKLTLQNFITSQPVSDDTLMFIMKQVFQVINYLHKRQLVHGRLTLKSFAIDECSETPKVALVDYLQLFRKTPMCQANWELLAPENFFDEWHSQQGDIWACGVLAIQLLLSKCPLIPGQSFRTVKERIVKTLDLEQIQMSAQCFELLQNVLRIDPKQRFTAFQCLVSNWFLNHLYSEPLTSEMLYLNLKRVRQRSNFLKLLQLQFIIHNLESQDEVTQACVLSASKLDSISSMQQLEQLLAQRMLLKGKDFRDLMPLSPEEFIISIIDRKQLVTEQNIASIYDTLGTAGRFKPIGIIELSELLNLPAKEVEDWMTQQGISNLDRKKFKSLIYKSF